jgi:hypothetical protein
VHSTKINGQGSNRMVREVCKHTTSMERAACEHSMRVEPTGCEYSKNGGKEEKGGCERRTRMEQAD